MMSASSRPSAANAVALNVGLIRRPSAPAGQRRRIHMPRTTGRTTIAEQLREDQPAWSREGE